jgi:hypothetical protein
MDCKASAKEWELLLALEKEKTFSDIRRSLAKLTKMRRTLNSYGPEKEHTADE